MSNFLWRHEPQHIRLLCPSLSPWIYSNSSSLNQWYHPNISSSVAPFSSLLALGFSQYQGISNESALFINAVWFNRSVVSDSLRPHGLYSPWNSPGQDTGMGSLSLLQGIFLTQQLNPDLPHCRRILYQLSHKWSPRILKWIAYLSLLHWIFPIQESN